MTMKLKVIFLMAFATIISFTNLYGQSFTITGIVSDSVSNEKLFYANVVVITNDTLHKTISYATTDIQGFFELTNIPAGEYLLKVSYVGYEVYSQLVSVKGTNKKIDVGNINLTANSTMLGAVEITAKKPVYSQEGEKTLYNVSEDPTIQSGTASDALQNAPGVEVDIEGNITLRGVSSVEIWLNGKPSRMNAEDLKNYIQMLPANTLQRIEVITNPSARYTAKGTGGIINIVTNDNIKKNSFYSFGVRASTRPDATPWFSYVWSNKKWDFGLYSNLSYYNWKSNNSGYSTYFNDLKDTVTHVNNDNNNKSNSLNGGLYMRGSYQIDSMNHVSAWIGSYFVKGKGDNFEEIFRHEFIYDSAMYHYTTNSANQYGNLYGYMGCNFEHKFNDDGHEIDASLGGSTYGNNSSSNYIRDFELQNHLDQNKKNIRDYSNYSLYSEINYAIPYIEDGEIAIGIEGDYGVENELFISDTLIWGTENYVLDSLRFKDAKAIEKELDSYITIQHTFGNFTIKGGLRGEYLSFNTNYFNSPKDNLKKSYFGLYPSIHLSYRTKSMHNFKLGYTRRVSNPDAGELSTFIDYDEDSYSTGNPDLIQTFTNSFEGGWTKFFDKFGNIGVNVYFKNTTNDINLLSDVKYNDVFGRVVSYTMYVNSGKSYQTGIDANVTYRLKSFMQLRLYGNLSYSNMETYYQPTDETVVTKNLNYRFRLNYWAKLWNLLEVNVSGNYSSANKSLFSEKKPTYSINCGLRADFLNKKISVYVNASDIFNWNKTDTNKETPYLISYNTRTTNSRYIGGGITFRFGKIELESKVQQGQGGVNMGDQG